MWWVVRDDVYVYLVCWNNTDGMTYMHPDIHTRKHTYVQLTYIRPSVRAFTHPAILHKRIYDDPCSPAPPKLFILDGHARRQVVHVHALLHVILIKSSYPNPVRKKQKETTVLCSQMSK